MLVFWWRGLCGVLGRYSILFLFDVVGFREDHYTIRSSSIIWFSVLYRCKWMMRRSEVTVCRLIDNFESNRIESDWFDSIRPFISVYGWVMRCDVCPIQWQWHDDVVPKRESNRTLHFLLGDNRFLYDCSRFLYFHGLSHKVCHVFFEKHGTNLFLAIRYSWRSGRFIFRILLLLLLLLLSSLHSLLPRIKNNSSYYDSFATVTPTFIRTRWSAWYAFSWDLNIFIVSFHFIV